MISFCFTVKIFEVGIYMCVCIHIYTHIYMAAFHWHLFTVNEMLLYLLLAVVTYS